MLKTSLIMLCCLSFYSHAKILTGQAEGDTQDIAKFKALQTLVQQLNVQAYQDSNLSLLALEGLPNAIASEFVYLSLPLTGLKYFSEQSGNQFKATVSYDLAQHLLSLDGQLSQQQKKLASLREKMEGLSLENLNILMQLDMQLQSHYQLALALRLVFTEQGRGSSITPLTATERDKANSRIDTLSQLQASSPLEDQSAAAKDIYSALAEQISVTITSQSTTESQLDQGSASQRFRQLTETLTTQTLTGVKITATQETDNNAKYVGTMYPRQSAMQSQRKVDDVYKQLLQSLAKSYESELDRYIDHLTLFARYQRLLTEYNTLVSLYGGLNTTSPASSLLQYYQTLESALARFADSKLTLSDVAKVVGYFNGGQEPLSLCPVWPLPETGLKNSAVLSQNMLQLVPEADELSRVLRLSVKQDNQLLAEIVEAKGQVVYSQMFSLNSNEFSQKIEPPAGTLVVLTDTSEQTLLSTDELFDVLQQEVDLSESLKIKGQCIPNLNEPQNKQGLSLLSENLVEVDINYLFDSTTISGMPVPIEFCRVRVNGKAYNLQSNKTVSLFAEGKQAPYTEQSSAIAQASSKAFKKLKRRLENTLEK
jgi:hypothetical protein